MGLTQDKPEKAGNAEPGDKARPTGGPGQFGMIGFIAPIGPEIWRTF